MHTITPYHERDTHHIGQHCLSPLRRQPPARRGGAVIVAQHSYRLHTLTTRNDALVLVLRGCKQLISATQSLSVPAGQAVMMAGDTTWDVVNDPRRPLRYEALALAFRARMDGTDCRPGLAPAAPPRTQCQAAGGRSATLIESTRRSLGSPDTSAAVQRHRLQEVLLLLA